MMHEPDGYAISGYLPPTPGDASSEKAQRKLGLSHRTQSIVNGLKARGTRGSALRALNEDMLVELRASRDYSFELPFEVDEALYREWDNRLSDSGGYEYDAGRKKLIIKTVPGPLHEGVVQIFSQWFTQIEDSGDLAGHGEINFMGNQSLSSSPIIDFHPILTVRNRCYIERTLRGR